MAVLTVSGLACLAAWISYHHMLTLAERAGERGIDGHAFPLTVDGLDVIGLLVLLADRRNRRRSGPLPWITLGVGTVASITANIAVAPGNIVARAISGWTAIALLAAAKMLAHLFEPTQPAPQAANPVAAPQPASEPVGDGEALPDPTPEQPIRRQRGRGDTARRLPTSEATLARWRAIWEATKHLDAATRDAAAEHGVSLRTLQFIRAAGEDGHLTETPAEEQQLLSAEPAAEPEPGPALNQDAVLAGAPT